MATTKIKCPVEGIIDLDRLPGVPAAELCRIIDAPELQRLRRIKQLGFSERVYPGATHSRFVHSLGAFQGAQRAITQLRRSGAEIPDAWHVATALACLLHDLGHGPFSHSFEAVSGRSHEGWTQEIIAEGPTIPGALESIEVGLTQRVLQLVRGEVEVEGLRYLADLVSSSLDCDRMDYLRRDAMFTGAHYGVFDRDWVIREIEPSEDGAAIVVVEKGRTAVEQYLIGRYHMFQNVYLHKTSRGFETAFRGLCRRLHALGSDSVPVDCPSFACLHELPLSLDRFLELDDIGFEFEFRSLLKHEDRTVAALAAALYERHPLRQRTSLALDPTELDEEEQLRREAATAAGFDADCAVWRDAAKDVPYRPYSPDSGSKGLRVRLESGDLVDITELSPTIRALAQPLVVHRLYWIDVST